MASTALSGAPRPRFARRAFLAAIVWLALPGCGVTEEQDFFAPPYVRTDLASGIPAEDDSQPWQFASATDGPIDVVLVPESTPWLLAVAAPVAAKERNGTDVPIVVALSTPPTKEAVTLIERLSPRRCAVLTPAPNTALAQGLAAVPANVLRTGNEPARAGVLVAKRFWREAEEVVMASIEDTEAVLLGGTLAAHLVVPFVPVGSDETGREIAVLLNSLNTKRVLVATCARRTPRWAAALRDRAMKLDRRALEGRLIRRLGPDRVRNVILARVPSDPTDETSSAWLTPYLSLVRGSAVALCPSSDGHYAEERVADLVRAHRLAPRSITILADPSAIGLASPVGASAEGEFALTTCEPCSRPTRGRALSWSVGRIPSVALRDASVLLARTFARERILASEVPHLLMVANPASDMGALPLCETVSRVTAAEFKNCRFDVDEFYGGQTSDPAVLAAAQRAHLVLYEGHLYDQRMFENPAFFIETDPPSDLPEPIDNQEDNWALVQNPQQAPWRATDSTTVILDIDGEVTNTPDPQQLTLPLDLTTALFGQPGLSQPVSLKPLRPRAPRPLHGLPLVILQSCVSLDEAVSRRIFESGGVGVIGSTTNIHSASGSSFMKAFCDGLVYRGETLGEALRGARNYFLCLNALKNSRGHKQQAKGYRVALSFRLWADPELRLFPPPPKKPRRRPVAVTLGAPNTLTITTPKARLPESRTDNYYARVFPGSQVAGIVKRMKSRPARRLMPLYFAGLPTPAGFDPARITRLRGVSGGKPRCSFLVDGSGKRLYVLYFPKGVKPNETVTLQFN